MTEKTTQFVSCYKKSPLSNSELYRSSLPASLPLTLFCSLSKRHCFCLFSLYLSFDPSLPPSPSLSLSLFFSLARPLSLPLFSLSISLHLSPSLSISLQASLPLSLPPSLPSFLPPSLSPSFSHLRLLCRKDLACACVSVRTTDGVANIYRLPKFVSFFAKEANRSKKNLPQKLRNLGSQQILAIQRSILHTRAQKIFRRADKRLCESD